MIWVVVLLSVALVACLWQIKVMSDKAKEASRVKRAKQAFLRNLSHEVRTPLQTVSGLAEVIADESLYLSKSEKRNISDQIQYNASLISTLFDEAMLLTDISTGHAMKEEEFSPNLLCRRCMDAMLRQKDGDGEVKIVFKRELSDEYFIHADSHLVELVLNKLLVNARRFTEKGEIVVGCNTTENPGLLTIYVQDTGAGIPEERKGELFNWFEHPDDLNDDAEISLSVANILVRKMGGMLNIDSRYQNGTRMLIVLPIK